MLMTAKEPSPSEVAGIPNERYWVDEHDRGAAELTGSQRREDYHLGEVRNRHADRRTHNNQDQRATTPAQRLLAQ